MDRGCFAESAWSDMAYMNTGTGLMWDPIYNPVVVTDPTTKKDTRVAMWTFLTDTCKTLQVGCPRERIGEEGRYKELMETGRPSGVFTPEVI